MTTNKDDDDSKMIAACQEGDEAAVKILLQQQGFHWKKILCWKDKEDVELETPAIFIAIDFGRVEIVRILLDATSGDDLQQHVNIKDSNDYSPLTWASMNGHLPLVELLLEKGATVDQDAIDMAKENGYNEIHERLRAKMDWYADIDEHDVDEIMIKASREGDVKKVQELIANGYNFDRWKNKKSEDAKDDGEEEEESYQQYSPIFFAMKNGHIDVIREFLQAGVEAELQETHFHHDVIAEKDAIAEEEDGDDDDNNHKNNTELTAEQIEAISAQFLAAEEAEAKEKEEQAQS